MFIKCWERGEMASVHPVITDSFHNKSSKRYDISKYVYGHER